MRRQEIYMKYNKKNCRMSQDVGKLMCRIAQIPMYLFITQ